VDDLNDWVGFLGGHPQTKTPNMDRLAKMGMVFENAGCAAPISNASRAALLSGYRPSTTGVYGNTEFPRESEVLKNAVMLPKYFSNHGYISMARGKIFHNPMGEWADPQSWDILENSGGKNMEPVVEKGNQANGLSKQTTGGSVVLDWAGVDVDEKETNDYLNAEWAAKELMKKQNKPFFLACGIFRPHLPWYVPQKYFDRFNLDSIKLPLCDNADDMVDLPPRALSITGYGKPDFEFNVIKKMGMQKDAVRAYLACIS
jgi:arylsulfatase A-like enzyme